jgi:uncharacterized protein with NRDE domain
MCLILFSHKQHPHCPLVIAANRDEFYNRGSSPAVFWEDEPGLLAGRDLVAGGTWFGVTRSGRIAAITNYREPGFHRMEAPSRGALVAGYLSSAEAPEEYLKKLEPEADRYNGFSLIVGEPGNLFYFSNRREGFERLAPGLYGLSNHLLDAAWPKVERGKQALAGILASGRDPDPEELFQVLADRWRPPDDRLPRTGVGLEWERILSSLFITSPVYGTRSSTVLLVQGEGRVTFVEKVFNSAPEPLQVTRHEFDIEREGMRSRMLHDAQGR